MEPSIDPSEPVPEPPAISRFGSTSLLIAVIALVSAVGSFSAVRAWFPNGQPASDASASTSLPAAATGPGQDVVIPRDVETISAAGRLSIVTDPAGARVQVDGRPRGVSPLVIDGLAAGEHLVAVATDMGASERSIVVSKDVMTEVVFSLPRRTAPVAGWVTLAAPFPIEMVEHDEIVGTSGAAKIMLAAGKHEILLRSESVGFEQARTITVVPGVVSAIQIDPPKGSLNVNARPWADVLIDGELVGQTPLSNLSIAIGPHQVAFRHPQFGERIERIVVTARSVNRVAVDFTK